MCTFHSTIFVVQKEEEKLWHFEREGRESDLDFGVKEAKIRRMDTC